jgi:hypothetical protein
MNKVVFVKEPVTEDSANSLMALTLYLDSVDQKRIYYWLNCPGGEVVPTLALYDTMQYVRSPTATVGYGMCLGMGGFLLACGGEKVRRPLVVVFGGEGGCFVRMFAVCACGCCCCFWQRIVSGAFLGRVRLECLFFNTKTTNPNTTNTPPHKNKPKQQSTKKNRATATRCRTPS